MSDDISGNCMALNPSVYEEQARIETIWGLRLRNRIEDLSENTVVHPSPKTNLQATYSINLNEVYTQGIFYLLRFLSLSEDALAFIWLLFSNIIKGVTRTFQDEQYVFFNGLTYPYLLGDVHLWSPGVPEVEWYYNAKTRTFYTSDYINSEDHHPRHISYLTAEVKYNDLILYDISDFVNSVRWFGEEGKSMPSIHHILSAWTLFSGIVLQRSDQMTLAAINTDGDEISIPLREQA